MIIKNKLEKLMFNELYNAKHKNGPRFCGDCIYNIPGKFYSSYYIKRQIHNNKNCYLYLLVMKFEAPNMEPYVEVREAILSEDCSTWNCSDSVIFRCTDSKQLKTFINNYKNQYKIKTFA